MAKKRGSKRSLSSTPKGLPQKKARVVEASSSSHNPFEIAKSSNARSVKHHVHNRHVPGSSAPQSKLNPHTSALARSLKRRKDVLRQELLDKKKSNAFVDKRIGESGAAKFNMTQEDKMLARIVRERSRRSKRTARFALEDDDADGGGMTLTHGGKVIDESYNPQDHVILSDDDEDKYSGNLEKVDTELHFGGGAFDRAKRNSAESAYGPSSGAGGRELGDVYRSRKMELDEMIARKKMEKAERMKRKENQVETFEEMDESFKELASILQFRDKEKEHQKHAQAKKAGMLSKEDEEMEDWDREMKEYLFERKVKATDRTKTPEEIAQEEAKRLQELETKRLARMNNDFEDDDLSDISDDDTKNKRQQKKKKKRAIKKVKSAIKGPDELDSDDEDEDENKIEARFTSEGLVYVDKKGNIVKNPEDESDQDSSEETPTESDESDAESSSSSDEEDDGSSSFQTNDKSNLSVGMKVMGNYRLEHQFEGRENWYPGTISNVKTGDDGKVLYDVSYNDGDFEADMIPSNVRPIKKEKMKKKEAEEDIRKKKQLKAKVKARSSMPFVFEVPTTLEALHDMIATHASTGADASLVIQRIYAANSVRLNKNNKEKMQNFYDVLLRRFIAVGDAVHSSGDGGPDLGRYEQLNALTKILYKMAQDSPECAGAVWGRRLGIFQKALAKRLRDSELVSVDGCDDDEGQHFSAWPSTGTILLLRALGHIFPVTDKRHPVVTPALLLLGQTIAQAPVRSHYDLVAGLFCSGLMIEYTKGAKRFPPEALAFLAGVLRLFSLNAVEAASGIHLPTLEIAAKNPKFALMRRSVVAHAETSENAQTSLTQISLDKKMLSDQSMPTALICSTLKLVEIAVSNIDHSIGGSETEVMLEIHRSLLHIAQKSKRKSMPPIILKVIKNSLLVLSAGIKIDQARLPLNRRSGATTSELAVKSLAPRMEDPTRYAMSKDKNKSQTQAMHDRNRREYKREHKAAMRELRLDAAFIENERRKDRDKRDSKAREKRHRNFAWLEDQQAHMNEQVRMGGGLLSGGGTGAARAKAASAKLGIKKGGKF
uniref:Nucleolar protein 14 n=1 Tax=Ditylum brightwellii TaxID=49249 RepID=A0A7S1VXK9_9STRA|mmetsp:Transcript_10718/g.15955  ORF Transcript_10718/g.15955 Transcript_10718/m.15955 type:complete len:1058 (+) Transcript_10718:131-3304(+)